MVDPKSLDFQSALPNSASNIFDNKDGCIQERLESSLSGNSNRRGMEFTGIITSNKCIGNEGSKTSFQKHFQMKAIHFQIDNTTALFYLVNMGESQTSI